MYDIENCVGFQTSSAAKAMEEYIHDKLMSLGITRVQWIALYFIGIHTSISQSCLAKKMMIKSSTAARLVDRMERDHYIRRVKNSSDKRVIKLHLTPKGRFLREQVIVKAEMVSEVFNKDISKEDLQTFTDVLNKIITNICH